MGPSPGRGPWTLRLGLAAGALLLTAVFVVAGFPWDRLRGQVTRQLELATGAHISIQRMHTTLTLAGPAFALEGVTARWPERAFALERAELRPAWSFAWLTGTPALHLDLRGPLGRAKGTLTLGSDPGWDGALTGVPLAQLPLDARALGASLDGIADIEASLRLTPQGPRGALSFQARDGSLAADGLPMALPYSELRGAVDFTDDGAARLEGFELDGPMLGARVDGLLEGIDAPARARADLRIEVEVRERALVPLLQNQGARIDADGKGTLKLRGPLQRLVAY